MQACSCRCAGCHLALLSVSLTSSSEVVSEASLLLLAVSVTLIASAS